MNPQEEAREMLSEDLREQRAEEAGAGRTLLPLVRSLSKRGNREALVAMLKEEAERWSYAELAERVGRLAAGLAEAGVSKGDHVALFAGGSPAWVAACLAVISRGAIVVPLDAQLGEEALKGILSDCGAKLVFTAGPQAEKLERAGDAPRVVLLDAGEEDERSLLRLLSDGAVEMPEVGPDDPVTLFYTSGTTGTPKGVPLTHGNLEFQTRTLLAADLLKDSDRILLPLPLHHVYPFVIGMLTPLSAGLPVIMPRSLTGPQLVRALKEGEVSLIVGVPRLYDALFSGIEERAKGGGKVAATLFEKSINLSINLRRRTGIDAGRFLMGPLRRRIGQNLRVLASGGAPLDPALAGKLEGMGWRVAVGYGLTETSPLLSLKLPDGGKLASVGRPVPGTSLRVDPSAMPDGEEGAGRTDRPNEEGEILARGPGVFSGYRNRPEETEKVLTGDGWFRTGDLGYFDDDGYLYVTGRASTLIVTEGGKNVQPEPVEEAYAKSPAIAEVGVLQKDGRLVALIVPETSEVGEGDPGQAIRAAVGEGSRRLPSYQRISDYAITREPLEYTQLGKLRRHLLSDRYDRAKAGDEGSAAPGPVPIEEMSAADRELLQDEGARGVWELLARRYADKPLSPNTSPQLDLGVDSLGWVNLTMEIAEKTGVELGEEAISRIDTVRDLLREVAEAAEGGTGARVARRVSPLEHPEEALSDEQKSYLQPLSPARSAAARTLFLLDRALMKSFFRLRVEGAEHLPKEGPFVVAPNHLSYLDSFAVAAALDRRTLRRTHWAGWTGAAFGNPLTRAVSRLAQAFPVDSERAGASSLAFGAMVLKGGRGLVWFPEGQRSADGELQPFKPGIGMLLDEYRVPVVPVSLRGSYEAMPPGKALPRLGRGITVTFGKPLDPNDLEREGNGEEPKDRILAALREHIAKLGAEPARLRRRDDTGSEA
ncbi:MAG: AMP-binding protein [Actinomycetota bacterium]|nr:AMP-binding protein [Actinomycetota bacterium]